MLEQSAELENHLLLEHFDAINVSDNEKNRADNGGCRGKRASRKKLILTAF